MSFNATLPNDDSLLINTPGYLRANWAAIALGTDPDLLITNAKVSPTAAIVDTKLAQITTAGKVAGSALTTLSGIPAGAGNIPLANIPGTLTGKSADQLDGQEGSYYLALGNATGTLAVANGGLGANFAATLQGNILYFSATGTIAALPPGTSGQYLKTQGAGANPTWDNAGSVSLLSTTPISSAATTGNITLAANKMYLVQIAMDGDTNNVTLYLRFNADSVGDDHSWMRNSMTYGASPSDSWTGDDADTEIQLGDINPSTSGGFLVGYFIIDTHEYGSNNAALQAHYLVEDSSGISRRVELYGRYTGGSVTSFSIVSTGGTFNALIRVY